MIELLLAAAALIVRDDRLFIPAKINGVAVEAVLDSAAEASIVDDEFAAAIKAGLGRAVTARGSGGSAPARLISGARIEAIGIDLPEVTVAVIDLDDVGKRLFGRRLDAIVGRELFDAGRLVIDVQKRSIAPLGRSARPQGVRLPLTGRRGVETIPVSIDGRTKIAAEFDLGNGSDLLIGRGYARRTGLLARAHTVESGGGIGGAVRRRVVTLRTVRIAGVTFRNVRAAIDDQPNAADANIGVRLLRHFRIVTDFPQRAVWLEHRGRRPAGGVNG